MLNVNLALCGRNGKGRSTLKSTRLKKTAMRTPLIASLKNLNFSAYCHLAERRVKRRAGDLDRRSNTD